MNSETVAKRAAEKARVAALPTIRCSCGCVWKGRATENNPVIEAHRRRTTCHVTVEAQMTAGMFSEIQQRVDSLEKALKCAYSGSAEHGSFLRGSHTEYVPSVFLMLDQLRTAVREADAELVRLRGAVQQEQEDAEYWHLCADGIKHSHECPNHFQGHPDAPECTRCRADRAEAQLAALRPYCQHELTCDVFRCVRCGCPEFYHTDATYDIDSEACARQGGTFEARRCSCGLNEILTGSPRRSGETGG